MQDKVFGNQGNFDREKDLVILAGDTNVCSLGNYFVSGRLQEIEKCEDYKPVLPLLRNEYKFMKKVLEQKYENDQYIFTD